MNKNISKLIAERLRFARVELGMTLQQAAKKLGFPHYQTLASIEKGERSVKVAELAQFAKVYYRTIDFFLGIEPPNKSDPVCWRDKGDAQAAKLAERKFLQYCQDYAYLERLSGHKPAQFLLSPRAPIRSFVDAEDLAESIRKQLNLGSRPSYQLKETLESVFGIKILLQNTKGGGSAACTKGEFGMGILINATDAPWRQNFDIAHELYHLLLWRMEEPRTELSEKYAEKFASTLLLPVEPLRDEFRRRLHNKGINFTDVVALAREFGVSTEALLWRLVGLRLLKRNSVQEALKSDTLRQIDRIERKDEWGETPPAHSLRFVSLAFECLQQGLISRGKFAALIGIQRGEINQFLSRYGFTETGDSLGQIRSA